MGQNTKIDWADSTWNPVTGCLHGCEYCYARGIARRFGWCGNDEVHDIEEPQKNSIGNINPYPYGFDPTFHRYKLDVPQHWKTPRTIFVCSMADLFGDWVPDEWIKAVFDACAAAPQHRYLFLTKNSKRIMKLHNSDVMPKTIDCWWGVSTPHKGDSYNIGLKSFVSIEPIMEDFTGASQCHAGWVIIGAETGRRKDKVIPEKDWIMPFVKSCENCGTPVFMKESLREIMGDDFRQEFPWEATL